MTAADQLCEECRQERKRFAQSGATSSPACAELWRLAFSERNDAWHCIIVIFEPWLSRLCNGAIQNSPRSCGLSNDDLADVTQDVWHNIWRFHMRNPAESAALVSSDDIGRVLGLVKTTAKMRVVELCRKPTPLEFLPTDDSVADQDEDRLASSALPKVDPPDTALRLDILALLTRNITSVRDQIVAELMFLQNLKPQDVFDLRPDQFRSVGDANQVRQTLLRRIRTDHARQESLAAASLRFSTEGEEAPMSSHEPCPFDEGTLLDYANGHASAEIRHAIEATPACMQAAARLKAEVAAWQPYLREMACPTADRLVAYQEKQVVGTDYLVLRSHIERCPFCRGELQMLSAMDAVALDPKPSVVRRVVALLFQPPTLGPSPVLGEGSYHTVDRVPPLELFLRTYRRSVQEGAWMLVGRLRSTEDEPLENIESVSIEASEENDDMDAPTLSTTVDDSGAFTLLGLEAGRYRIRIITSTEEIVLDEYHIRDED
jgi:hypothetical protein